MGKGCLLVLGLMSLFLSKSYAFADQEPRIEDAVHAMQVHCEDEASGCPDYVGLVLNISEVLENKITKIAPCTGFVFQENNVMGISAHCLSKDIQKNGASCDGKLVAAFPDEKDLFSCDEVISVEGGDNNPLKGLDYAFVRLKRAVSHTLPLKPSREGLQDRLSVTLAKVDWQFHGEGKWEGVVHEESCFIRQRTYYFPNFNHSYDQIGITVGCDVQGGNSGAPLLDQNGNIRGIMHGRQGILSEDYYKFKLPNDVEGIVSNMSCIPERDAGGPPLPEECANKHLEKREYKEKAEKRIQLEFSQKMEKDFRAWFIESSPKGLLWRMNYELKSLPKNSSQKAKVFAYPAPRCLLEPEKLSYSGGVGQSFEYTYPTWFYWEEVDETHTKHEIRVLKGESYFAELYVMPQKNEKVFVMVTPQKAPPLFSQEIGACKISDFLEGYL